MGLFLDFIRFIGERETDNIRQIVTERQKQGKEPLDFWKAGGITAEEYIEYPETPLKIRLYVFKRDSGVLDCNPNPPSSGRMYYTCNYLEDIVPSVQMLIGTNNLSSNLQMTDELREYIYKSKFSLTEDDECKTSSINKDLFIEREYENLYTDVPLVVEAREVINNPLKITTENNYMGLVVKVVEKIAINSGYVYKIKWISLKNGLPANCVITGDICTSYTVNRQLKNINKNDKNDYPIIYMPLSELIIWRYNYAKFDNRLLLDSIKKFHLGEQLSYVKINSDKLVIDNYHLVKLAMDLKLSHIPVIIGGNYAKKLALQKQFREGVVKK